MFSKLGTNRQSDKAFLLTSKFCPQWLSAPALGIYVCKIINEANEVLLELVQNDANNKSFTFSLPAQDQLSGQRYRTVGSLLFNPVAQVL